MAIKDYSSTAASNTAISGIGIAGTNVPSNFDNALRQTLADIANWTDSDTVASATTTDLGSVEGMYVTVSGTATITGFGTLKAGMVKFVYFSGAGQITHNATSMILLGGANIARAAGDTAVFVSEGSGNWRCIAYSRASDNWVDVASATTTDIGAATSQNIRITGSTTITGLGTVAAGTFRRLRFASVPILTYNATSLILPGAANITAAAGDVAEFISEGSGNWRCINYLRAAYPPSADVWETITVVDFSSVSAFNVSNLDGFKTVKIEGRFNPGTDAVTFGLITSADNGSTYATTAGDYSYTQVRSIAGTASANNLASATEVSLSATTVGNGGGEALALELTIYDFNKAVHSLMRGSCCGSTPTPEVFTASIMGKRNSSQALNAFRVYVSSGTFSGYYIIRGIRG